MRNLLFGLLATFLVLPLAAPASGQDRLGQTRPVPTGPLQPAADPTIPSYLRRNEPAPQVRRSPRSRMVLDRLYNGRTRRNPVEAELLRQGYDVAGKLPILPAKPDTRIRDAAGNILPSRDPSRYYFGPALGNRRTMRYPLMRNRLSPSEIGQQQLYRGPSRPGMIAPRAQQERTTPSARDLNRRVN